MRKVIGVIVAVLFLASCATRQRPPYYKEIPPLTKVPGLGVTFMIPDEEGWAFFDPDGKGSMIVKTGKTNIESYVISLDRYTQRIPGSEEKFLEFYEALKKDNVTGPRYSARIVEEEIDNSREKIVVNFYYLVEDHGAKKRPSTSKYMLLEAMGFFTIDPNRPDTRLIITYTHRYAPGNEDPSFKEKAKWVLDRVLYEK